ncbi:uncharacterized protein LOC142358486, partial [Convolutriloba macropyga]|uniref:uncharacterized protein LOC142358486 n=1 Tax=Convolutriloba macropyga TaxID=536237 RepID=UPI003F525E9D
MINFYAYNLTWYTQAPEDWKTDLEPFIFRQALISEYSILTNVIISTVAAIINLYCLLSCMIVDELRKKEFYLIGLQSLCDCVSSSAFITWGLAYYAHRFFFYCFGEHYDET